MLLLYTLWWFNYMRKFITMHHSSLINKAKYMALSNATKKGICLHKLLNELWDEHIEKVSILIDNKGSIKLVKNQFFRNALCT